MNQLIRMVLRFAMTHGVDRAVNFYADRQEQQIDPDAPGAEEMRAQTKEQARSMKQRLRMMRRFLRF